MTEVTAEQIISETPTMSFNMAVPTYKCRQHGEIECTVTFPKTSECHEQIFCIQCIRDFMSANFDEVEKIR